MTTKIAMSRLTGQLRLAPLAAEGPSGVVVCGRGHGVSPLQILPKI